MTEPADYTAKIRAKGLDATGITEQLAAEMFRNKGRHYMAIVEVKVDETHEKADGARKVDLVLTQVEPAGDSALEEHLRELTRVGYLNRQQSDGQLAIDQSLGAERTVADVMASGQRYRPHPFLPVDASEDNPICDVCGSIEATAVHSEQQILDDADDEAEQRDEPEHDLSPADRAALEQDEDPDVDALTDEPAEDEVQAVETSADPYTFVHAKGGSLPGEETVCALHATVGKNLHTHDDRDQVTCPDCIEQLDVDASFRHDDTQAQTPTEERHLSAVADPFTAPAAT